MTRKFPLQKAPEELLGGWELTGRLEVTADAFVLTLDGARTESTEPPIDPPPTELPPDAVVLEPSGGDDTERLRDAVNAIPEGGTLVLRGMFRVSDTISTSGGRRRTVMGYPGERSGILVESADMPGFYGAMLQFN